MAYLAIIFECLTPFLDLHNYQSSQHCPTTAPLLLRAACSLGHRLSMLADAIFCVTCVCRMAQGASNAEDAEALSHAEESGHQSAAGKPPLNASQTFRGQSLPSAFRKWCKSIDGEIAFRSPVRDHVRASMPQRLPSPGGKPHDRSQMLRELSKSFPAIVAAAAASPAHERSTSSSPSSVVRNETQPSQPSEQQTVGIQDGMEGILDGILLDPVLTVMQVAATVMPPLSTAYRPIVQRR